MKRYKVVCSPSVSQDENIVEAESEAEAIRIAEDISNQNYDFMCESIEEIKDE